MLIRESRMKGAIMEEKKYTADGMNIEVDKYEDEKYEEI